MCLAIPTLVVELLPDNQAVVDLGGVRKAVSIELLDEVAVGDYVIIHVGYALTRLDPEEAAQTLALMAEAGIADLNLSAWMALLAPARMPRPLVDELNRAVAVGMAEGPRAGLAIVDAIADEPALRDYHLLPGVRGDLLQKLGRNEEARAAFETAAELAGNRRDRSVMLRRAKEVPAP